MNERERFEQRLERQRRAFNECWDEQLRTLVQPFPPLGQAIIIAAITHFERRPFSESEMASYLTSTGRWPHNERNRDRPERTVNTYCNQDKYVGRAFDSLGGARFCIKDKYAPEPTGLHDRHYDFRTDPDEE